MLLPELAVQPGAEGSYVFVVDADDKAQLHPVTIARQLGSEVVIAAGLVGGERVVAKAPRDLKPGTLVTVVNAKPAANPTGDGSSKVAAP